MYQQELFVFTDLERDVMCLSADMSRLMHETRMLTLEITSTPKRISRYFRRATQLSILQPYLLSGQRKSVGESHG